MWSVLVSIVLLAIAAAQGPALRVVVIEGEDAVNVIQQKTAVRPVVEVRDRNNLPVSGALVTFSIEGGKAASFGGASTLTVATNAAGQAAVTGLTPSAAGAFQIQVSAAFQGQVATATIAQTNVMTAAQAAAAGAASGSGGSAGGSAGGGAGGAAGGAGGGLSATTIVVAGAAVAGGAVAATQLVDKVGGGSDFTGSFTGTITGTFTGGGNCTYSRSVSATAKLRFDEHTDSAVRGHFEFTGTQALIAAGCPMPTPPDFSGGVMLSGSPASFSGRNAGPQITNTSTGQAGETITGSHTYTFEGSINGETATGTFRYEERSVSTGGRAGQIDQLGVGTFSITFQKS
jgi:hypothetical protein